MNDYIKREDAIQAIVGHLVPKQYDGNLVNAGFEVAHEIVDVLPSADVAEVVRCKDCKHHEELLNNNDGNVLCWAHGLDVVVDRNGYCNYGEREEQEHE